MWEIYNVRINYILRFDVTTHKRRKLLAWSFWPEKSAENWQLWFYNDWFLVRTKLKQLKYLDWEYFTLSAAIIRLNEYIIRFVDQIWIKLSAWRIFVWRFQRFRCFAECKKSHKNWQTQKCFYSKIKLKIRLFLRNRFLAN